MLARRPTEQSRPTAWRETWADFVFESRRAKGVGGRVLAVLGWLGALARLFIETIPTGEHPMRHLGHDVLHAGRRLRRTPLYTIFAALTLAVGIAATTSLYSLLYFVVWRPDAVVDPDRIVNLKGDARVPGQASVPGAFSWPDWQSLVEQQRSFSHVTGIQRVPTSILNNGLASVALGEGVTADYFPMVGVGPLEGRVLTRADSAPDAPLAVVLVARVARAQFGEVADAVGQTIKIGGQSAEVVGVVTDNFYGINPAYAAATFWIPIERLTSLTPSPWSSFDPARREMRWLTVRGRLGDGVSLARAAEDVSLIGRRVEAAFPTPGATEATGPDGPAGRFWRAESVNMRERDAFSSLAIAMMVGVLLVLLMVCANLANLGLSRSSARKPEFAVRRALGASRWRLVREQLVECSLVVSLGAVLAAWMTRWLITWLQMDVPISRSLTLALQPEVTWPVVAMAAGVCVLSMITVGLVPAWRATGADSRPLLGKEGATASPRLRSQHWLVGGQVAGSVALLLLAVSITQTVARGTQTPGVDVDRIAVASVNLYLTRRDPVETERLRDEVLNRVRQSPQVENVAAAVGLPFGIYAGQGTVAAIDADLLTNRGANAYLVAGTAELLPTLGVPLLTGRAITSDEVRDRRSVIVLSETIAREVFGSTDIVGRAVWFKRGTPVKSAPETLTVVGVSRDTDTFSMGSRHSGAVFLPLREDSRDQLVFVARTDGDPDVLTGVLRRAIRETDPSLVVDTAGTGWTTLSGRFYFLGALAWVSSGLGALTLVLVMTGLFGVLSALVTQQTREFGIRMAMGSTSAQLLRLVVWQGFRPALYGLTAGLVLGVLSRLALGAILPSGLAVVDVFAFVVVPVVIVATTVAASLLPARRAARVDPNVALRSL